MLGACRPVYSKHFLAAGHPQDWRPREKPLWFLPLSLLPAPFLRSVCKVRKEMSGTQKVLSGHYYNEISRL